MYPIIKPNITVGEFLSLAVPKSNPVEKFEEEFAKKIGCKYAIAFSYGRSGLYAVLKALDIKNKEVIMPAYTCIVVPNAVEKSGNKPVFVDIEKKNFNSSAEELMKKINKKTGVVLPTYMYGCPIDVARLRKKVGKDVLVVEDACLALLNKQKGKNLGTIGDLGFFSFNVSKQMTTYDGGMVVTDSKEYYRKIKSYRDKNFKEPGFLRKLQKIGSAKSSFFIYSRSVYGFLQGMRDRVRFLREKTSMESWDLDTISLPEDTFVKMTRTQARIGSLQLQRLEKTLEKRKKIVKWYGEFLKESKLVKPETKNINYSHYPVLVNNRDSFIKKMREKGVNVGFALEYSVPDTKAYSKYKGKFPNSLEASKKVINLPIYPGLEKKDVKKICNIVEKVLNG